MTLTQSKHGKRTVTKNGTRVIKPAIGLKRPENDKIKYNETIHVVLTLETQTPLPTRAPLTILGTGISRSDFCSSIASPGALLDKTQLAGRQNTH